MITSNKDLMKQAREVLSGRWGLAVGTFFVYTLIMVALGVLSNQLSWMVNWLGNDYIDIGGFFIGLLTSGSFTLGISIFALAIARREDANLEMIFFGFKYYGKATWLYLLITFFIVMWMVLLVVPGIIASISYSMSFFIMSDDPNISAREAIYKSKKMMYGYKRKFFCLVLRFFGWFLLGILTLGIGFFWIVPYMHISIAKFYEYVKENIVENIQHQKQPLWV